MANVLYRRPYGSDCKRLDNAHEVLPFVLAGSAAGRPGALPQPDLAAEAAERQPDAVGA